ncbi:MAG: hypothetical protein SGARI_006137, partial [Bacillariaceae sp.]
MNALNQQLKRIQRNGPQNNDATDSDSDNNPDDIPKDPVVAEWEALERRIDQEKGYRRDVPDENDSRGPLPPIIEANREKKYEEQQMNVRNN